MKYIKNSLIARRPLWVMLFALLFSACSVSKETRSMKRNIKGDWVLQTITTEGITGVAKTTIFNEAEFGCFIGSEWNFVSNNGMGSYNLIDRSKDCVTLKRSIRWSIYEAKDLPAAFQFNRLDDNKNAMANEDGYKLTITELDHDHMKLRSEVAFSGHAGAIIYNFVRK